jgi:hypothetical protein
MFQVLGVSECCSFGVRKHWIDPALSGGEPEGPSGGIRCGVSNLYDLPKLGFKPFDVTLFEESLFHLPYPIQVLRLRRI